MHTALSQSARHSAGRTGRRLLPAVLGLCLALVFSSPSAGRAERVTLLIPSKPSIEEPLLPVSDKNAQTQADSARKGAQKSDGEKKDGAKPAAKSADKAPKKKGAAPAADSTKEPAPAPSAPSLGELTDQVNASILASVAPQVIREEVDLLMGGMEPFRYRGISMDPPRLFSIYRFDRNQANPDEPAAREDRLGDIEEIRYLDQKAWGANVGLNRPGLYQFSIETQPWWEPSQAGYAQHLVKVMVPVCGEDWGWHLPLNLQFEIVADVRPFGLMAPALFTGHVLAQGKPAADISVRVCRINVEKTQVPTPWNESIALRTDASGSFSAVLNKPGWWCCLATRSGAPLKGPDGQPSPLLVSTLLWLYVDEAR
ncbi:MAG: DUF4198 domain-containing protein [Desulfovibrionaceae bacterium]|nr:DUF4198 domain-containing protein [Desulfovibrionaceae bacterium]